MAEVETMRRQVAHLSFEDGEVVVTPRDRDIFLISAERATEACRAAIRNDERVQRFQAEFLVPLHDWSLGHADKVRACYLTVPGRQVQVFVVGESTQFDFDLAEDIARLEMSLARQGWQVGVSQLPKGDDEYLAGFFHLEKALEVYAKPEPTSKQGG